MNINNILAELEFERDRLNNAITALESLNSTGRRTGRRARVTTAPKRRRHLSAAARARIAAAQRVRWAKVKQAKASHSSRRGMSRAARNRIAAAQRARWAKVKAGQQKKAAA